MAAKRKAKVVSKPVKKKAARPAAKKPAAKKPASVAKKAVAKKAAAKAKTATKIQPLDLSAFPPESISFLERWICLACVSEVFMRHLALAPRTAQREIKGYTPSIEELYASSLARPWFVNEPVQKACPYCGSGSKWLTWLRVYRIESGKATDALRRGLVKSLPQTGNPFAVLEEKATQQHAFFEWLEKISSGLDL